MKHMYNTLILECALLVLLVLAIVSCSASPNQHAASEGILAVRSLIQDHNAFTDIVSTRDYLHTNLGPPHSAVATTLGLSERWEFLGEHPRIVRFSVYQNEGYCTVVILEKDDLDDN